MRLKIEMIYRFKKIEEYFFESSSVRYMKTKDNKTKKKSLFK